ncbi:uncharacterized protein LOC126978446 [Leptidea sinapis]|uniref:Solute carrier family 66 member 3 n=1 Tax=Leptidea sinapis TaxID=189913 RepID=A0A5E4QQ48_9NEOP|nr:uncharacterized protein LOC126978446 [Leptidea sinapis]VVC99782.1 unnamed protein product [Leptidea sinapis]
MHRILLLFLSVCTLILCIMKYPTIFSLDSDAIVIPFQIFNIGIIILSLFLKVPQILKMRKRRQIQLKMLSIKPIIMELTGYSLMTLYNYKNDYAISTYLEYPVILLQVYFMIYLVLCAKRLLKHKFTISGIILYFIGAISFLMDLIPKETLTFIVPFCTPLSGFAKVSYIMNMMKNGNSDSISWLTWTISVITNLGRLLSVIMSSGDLNLLINYGISAVLSAGVLSAAIYYQVYPRREPIATRRTVPSVRRHYHLD